MVQVRGFRALFAAAIVASGCASEGGLGVEVGEARSALTSCTADAECAAGHVCAPAGFCVRPANCTAGASGSGMLPGPLLIDATDTLTDLQSLGGAWCVIGNVTIKQTALSDMTGLTSLVAVGGTLAIEDNSALASLHGLENLRRAQKLSLFRNPALASLGALSKLDGLTSLQVYVNPLLTDLGGLQGVVSISGAEVVNNAGLTSLSGLHSITRVFSYIDVRQNPLLTNLTGLNGVTTIGNLVQITDNPNLAGLDGLGNLTSIGNTFRVLRNPELVSFNALGNLTSARTFQVADNTELDSCKVTELATRVGADCSGCVRNGPCQPVDLCPDDPTKLVPGACGCGVADTDTDADAVADCVDPCPNDNPDDDDLDGVCTSDDVCPGADDQLGCAETCEFVPLGYLPSVQRNSAAFAVSDDGLSVTGRTHVSGGHYRAFRWTQSTGMVGLSSGSTSSGRAITANGSRIAGIGGSELNAESQFGFREQPTYIQTTPGPYTSVLGLSADGAVAVGEKNGYAMRWLEGSSTPTTMAFGFLSQANGVSADGSIIVGRGVVSGPTSGLEAFVWTSSGVIGLGDFGTGYNSSEATAISANGQIVVGTAAAPAPGGSTHGFKWTQSTGLVSLGANFTPYAVSDTGAVVGQNISAYVLGTGLGDGDLKVLLQGCGVDMTGWSLVEARDVTPDGKTIVGTGRNPSGNYEAVLMRLP